MSTPHSTTPTWLHNRRILEEHSIVIPDRYYRRFVELGLDHTMVRVLEQRTQEIAVVKQLLATIKTSAPHAHDANDEATVVVTPSVVDPPIRGESAKRRQDIESDDDESRATKRTCIRRDRSPSGELVAEFIVID
jgi:hypothetical protein